MGEVVQHLADSELVFGFRLRMVMAHDRPQLMGYDQDLWASQLHYSESDWKEALALFAVVTDAQTCGWWSEPLAQISSGSACMSSVVRNPSSI